MNSPCYSPFLSDLKCLLVQRNEWLYVEARIILDALSNAKINGDVEFYASPDWAQKNECSVAVAYESVFNHTNAWCDPLFSILKLKFPPNSGEPQTVTTLAEVRNTLKCMGAVQYKDGHPVAILDHRPRSPFILGLRPMFQDEATYWKQFDPVLTGSLTKEFVLGLPTGVYLVQMFYHAYSGVVVPAKQRPQQWETIPKDSRNYLCYVFRNLAHFHSWLEQKREPFRRKITASSDLPLILLNYNLRWCCSV
jgi:hypothetical protein